MTNDSPNKRVNLRHDRAEGIAAVIMSKIRPFLKPGEEVSAAAAMLGVLNRAGAELVTDDERAQAGLQRRSEFGYTLDDLVVIETRRSELLSQVLASAPDLIGSHDDHVGSGDSPDRRRMLLAIKDAQQASGSKNSLISLSMSYPSINTTGSAEDGDGPATDRR
jgi:hypothetical protein